MEYSFLWPYLSSCRLPNRETAVDGQRRSLRPAIGFPPFSTRRCSALASSIHVFEHLHPLRREEIDIAIPEAPSAVDGRDLDPTKTRAGDLFELSRKADFVDAALGLRCLLSLYSVSVRPIGP